MFKRARGANGSRLDLVKRLRRPEVGCDPAEFELEYLRLPHRHGGPQLLPAGLATSTSGPARHGSAAQNIRNAPIDRSASTRSTGIQHPASISAARALMSGANSQISASIRLAVSAVSAVSKQMRLAIGPLTRVAEVLMA